jgi:aspartate aminotransferase-like enzyme
MDALTQVPSWLTWSDLDAALRARGVVVGGSYGSIAGRVFRIGHMGSQANLTLLQTGLDILEAVLQELKLKHVHV